MKPRMCRLDRLMLISLLLAALIGLGALIAGPVSADEPDERYVYEGGKSYIADGTAAYVPNEYIIHVLPGTSVDSVKRAVEGMGATLVRAIALPDTYLIRLGRSNDSRSPRYVTVGAGGKSTTAPRPTVNTSWVIDRIQPNVIYRPTAEPTTDPLWVEQWDMKMINMPGAWNIEKGQNFVTVAVIDTGVAYRHPDLIDRCIPGYDTFDGDNDPLDTPPGDGVGHGTHVAGTIAAQGDNATGITGVCWDGVKIMPIRVLGPVDEEHTAGTTETITAGMEYALTHNAHVVNMSLGGPARLGDAAYRQKIAQLAQAGIVTVVAAGNDGDTSIPDVGVPALYPEVICVASVGETEEIATYSSYGPAYEVDIAAPGGDMYIVENEDDTISLKGGIWSTYIIWVEDEEIEDLWWGWYDYAQLQGTSMACPHVAGAAALLLSQGVPAAQVRSRLLQTAREPKQPIVFDRRKFGAGILDVQAALSNSAVKIVKPAKGSTVSSNPEFEINWRGVDPTSVAIYVDYVDDNKDGIPDNPAAEVPVNVSINPLQTSVSFKWQDVSPTPLRSGAGSNPHNVYVTANPKDGGSSVSDYVTFNVADKSLAGGLYLFSMPFILDTTSVYPMDVLGGTDFTITNPNRSVLQRYLAPMAQYETYVPGLTADRSWLNPMLGDNIPTGGGYFDLIRTDDTGRIINRQTNVFGFPAGSGFWLRLPPQTSTPVDESLPTLEDLKRSDGYVFDASRGYRIRLYNGWNMIGNPYSHAVSWRSIRVTYQGETKLFQDAVEEGWIQGSLFRYKNDGIPGYDRLSDKDSMQPYEGYWLRAMVGSMQPFESLVLTILP